jgi:hypothetical protein
MLGWLGVAEYRLAGRTDQRGAEQFHRSVPLTQVDDIGGVLYVGSRSYGCSIAPAK